MEKLELTDENIKALGIDPSLSKAIIKKKLFEIEDAFLDTEKNVIYINVLEAYNDIEYLEILEDCNIPQLHDLVEKLSHITNPKLNASLFRKGLIMIFEANIEAKNIVMKKILFEKKTDNEPLPKIDLSNSNAVQKIIYLNELGIIELLRKEPCFALSVNNLTNVITAITGEKNTTIQPYLNALLNKTGAENNNPYKTVETVKKVKSQLINLGIKPK